MNNTSNCKSESTDIFKGWHDHLKTIRDGFQSGKIRCDAELSDFDIAVQYVIGIAYEHNYKTLTDDMIFHLIKAFTDVEFDEA